MKKIFFVLIVVFMVLSPRILWAFKSGVSLDVLVIDKTVPTTDYREHNGLFWFLTNEKIVKPGGELYEIGLDYYGYDPYEEKAMNPYVATGTKDLIYIADTYGVYSEDLVRFSEGERSEKLYGGMDSTEWRSIMQDKGPETVLIAEYNSFASPTDEAAREVISDDLGVHWSGWSGRFFADFTSSEIPSWLIDNYERQYSKKWSFEQGGLAFVHTSDQILIIDEQQMLEQVQFNMTEWGDTLFEKVNDSDYHYWFDIVEPIGGGKAIAEYTLALAEDAQVILESAGIPLVFPAVTYNEGSNTYYFSGDFADYTKDNLMRWHRGDVLMRAFSNDESTFFWTTYIPLMRQILQTVKPTI